jgi:hypothetical protein
MSFMCAGSHEISLSQHIVIHNLPSVSVKQKEASRYSRNSFVETSRIDARLKKRTRAKPIRKGMCTNYLDIHTIIYIIVFIKRA